MLCGWCKQANDVIAQGGTTKQAEQAEEEAEVEGRNIIWWLQQKLRLRWHLRFLMHSQLGEAINSERDSDDVNPFSLATQQAAAAGKSIRVLLWLKLHIYFKPEGLQLRIRISNILAFCGMTCSIRNPRIFGTDCTGGVQLNVGNQYSNCIGYLFVRWILMLKIHLFNVGFLGLRQLSA